ncbi:MAG: sulfite exporter TauE/SafE family protein [Actinomycetota bacterium]
MNAFLAVLSGLFIGSVLGFVGAGGALVSVPILLYVFHFSPTQATTAALAIVLLAALSGAIPKMRIHDVLYREAFSIWGIGLITNISGSILSKHLPNALITTGFAVILCIAGVATLRGPIKADIEKRMPVGVLIVIALIIGAMTGIFGVGGGFLAIPVLVLFYNTPQNKAAGTSLLIISINSMTSFLGHHAVWHEVKWGIPIVIGLVAIVVSLVASHNTSRVPVLLLRKAFAYLLFALAIFTITKTWFIHS